MERIESSMQSPPQAPQNVLNQPYQHQPHQSHLHPPVTYLGVAGPLGPCFSSSESNGQSELIQQSAPQSAPTSNTNNNNNNNAVTSANIHNNQTQDATSQASTAHHRSSGQSNMNSTNGASNLNGASAARHFNPNVTGSSMSDSINSIDGHATPSIYYLSRTNLYIKGLQPSTTDQDLYNLCSRFGQITSTKAILEPGNGSCKGYGFVDFSSPQAADLAVKELANSGVQAQMARIRPMFSHNPHHQQNTHHHNHNNQLNYSSNSSKNDADPTNLYIANLPPNTSEEELENLLSTYGVVVSTRILRDQGNNPRGVGFARMESREKCEQIIENLGGRPYKGSKEPLLVKFADGANKKRHNNHNQHHHHHQHHPHHTSKAHHDDSRWNDSNELNTVSNFDHSGNMSHSNHLSEPMMASINYPRVQHGFSPVTAPYPPIGPATSNAQWMHPAQAGQHYVIPQQVLPSGALGPSSQPALHYAPLTQITAQMQGLQLAHTGPVGAYMPQQQWQPPIWPHPPMPRPPKKS